jgi:hypothetical protein
MKIICAFGQLMNGKDVFSDYLYDKLNNFKNINWERSSFAGAVKKVYKDAFGVNSEFIEKWKRISDCPEGMSMNVRQGLQFIGDGFRKIKNDIWIEIALRNKEKNLILSDGRYINEAKEVTKNGGINVLIYRKGFLNDDPNPSESVLRPLAEYCDNNCKDGLINKNIDNLPEGLNYFDIFIRNDGDLLNFYNKIDNVIIPLIKEVYY